MGGRALDHVRSVIAERGPIGFDEYMTLALYGPGGFFVEPPVGSGGHFVTAPHVHPFVFGHCVRDALLDTWRSLAEPDPFRVVELGAGDGTLAEAVLDAFGELPVPDIDYVGVDISSGARRALAARGLAAANGLSELEPFEGAMLANELLDNLPFLRVRGRADGPVEVRVGLDEAGALVEVEVPWARDEPPPPSLPDGHDSTVPIGTFALLAGIATKLRRGSALLVDYGSQRSTGQVHGYRAHRQVADVLAEPGGTDITAGVDWSLISERAGEMGFQVSGPITQADALKALGLERWERTMRELQSTLQGSGRGSEAVRVWETRSRASLLTEPSGMGSFGWLVLSRGVPEPAWLGRARDR